MNGTVLSFYLNKNLYGIPIQYAKEINRKVEYTLVPGETAAVVGLLNLRGQVVTLFDLSVLLNPVSATSKLGNHCIILKETFSGPDQVGFFVDRLGEVRTVTDSRCEPVPARVNHAEKKYISEVVQFDDQILLVLDLKRLFDIE